jgi:hypothetical protein
MASANDEEATVRTTVTIPKADYADMERIAREKRVSVAWVVREAVAQYLTGAGDSDVKQSHSRRGTRR